MQPTDPTTPAQPSGIPVDGVGGVVSSVPPAAQMPPAQAPAPVATPAAAEVSATDQVHQVEQTPHSGKLSIEPYLEEVIRRDASDIHVQVGLPPMLRVDGALAPIQGE